MTALEPSTTNLPAIAPGQLDAPEAHKAALSLLREAIGRLDAEVELHADEPDGLARALHLVQRMRGDLDLLVSTITEHLFTAMPDKTMVIEGVGLIEKRYGTANTNWDQDRCWELVADSARRNWAATHDGELPPPEVCTAIDETVHEARELHAAGGWKKTALRERGVDPDDVSEQSYGRKSIQITTSGWQQ
jgi:hypothetical protein